jgi:alpha-tubulin suppressor-like RCC1 family protein
MTGTNSLDLTIVAMVILVIGAGCKTSDSTSCVSAQDCFLGEDCVNGTCVERGGEDRDTGESPNRDISGNHGEPGDAASGEDDIGEHGEQPMEGKIVAELVAGTEHSCVRLATEEVWCWGDNGNGELGSGSSQPGYRSVPVPVRFAYGATELAVTAHTTCARLTQGEVRCVGSSSFGLLGGSTNEENDYQPVAINLTGVDAIVGGVLHVCAFKTGGEVWCWGTNNRGQAGGAITSDEPFVSGPTNVSGASPAQRLSLGLFHSCAMTTDGRLRCWGDNDDLQLGSLGEAASHLALGVYGLTYEGSVVDVAAGHRFNCAVSGERKVNCWGHNLHGVLGRPSTTVAASYIPLEVPLAGNAAVEQIGAGEGHVCVLRTGGEVWCWGDNTSGQLGNGTFTSSYTPVKADITGVTSLAVGAKHSCAVVAEREVRCWGLNERGRLGNNLEDSAPRPTRVVHEWND